MLRRFLRDDRGNMALIFAISAIPVMGAAAGALDYSNAYRQRTLVQNALDAAALAANKKIGTATTDEVKAEAANYFNANINGSIDKLPTLATTVSGGQVTVKTTLTVPTAMLGILGIDQIVFDLQSQSTAGSSRLEVVMVLDTSGSMAGSKITTLKEAATNLTNQLFGLAASSSKVDPVKLGVVPFASSVNVGPQYSTATWMDAAGKGYYHYKVNNGTNELNLDGTFSQNRFALYDTLKNTSWAGCVEERPLPYDATDDPPSTAINPSVEESKTLFVPMFAFDEPDNWTCTTSKCSYAGSSSNRTYSGAPTGSYSYNNYLKDNGGNCTGANASYTGDGNEKAQLAKSCKYSNATPSGITVLGIAGGPNFMCNSKPLTPLTTSQSTVLTAISALNALGATNITAGIAWGWRVLSPGVPFTEGRAYDDEDNHKILILMTDGENTYYPNSEFKHSVYGAYGYIYDKHMGIDTTNQATFQAEQDKRSKAACDNAKAKKITIYTISFEVNTTRGKELMAYCASDPAKNFDAENEAELLAAFDAIGTDISQLRLEK